MQQVFIEQRDFMKSKDIKLGRQFMVLMANGAVFATQFFAIKRMVEVGLFLYFFPTKNVEILIFIETATLRFPLIVL